MAARKKKAARKKTSAVAVRGTAAGLAPLAPLSDDWEDRLAAYVTKDAATAAGGTVWPYISLNGGVFNIMQEKYDEPLDVIILGAIRENNYYSEAYDPNNPQAPDCYALAYDEEDLAPPADLETRIADKCDTCPYDAFGSADTGRGKACKNTVRLAVIAADRLDVESLKETEGARLRVPTMSIAGKAVEADDGSQLYSYASYANRITKGLGRPLFTVVTRMTIVDDEKSQFRLMFTSPGAFTDKEAIEVLESRAKEAETYVTQVPQIDTTTRAKPRGGKKAPRRRKVSARKASGAKTAGASTNGARKKRGRKADSRKF